MTRPRAACAPVLLAPNKTFRCSAPVPRSARVSDPAETADRRSPNPVLLAPRRNPHPSTSIETRSRRSRATWASISEARTPGLGETGPREQFSHPIANISPSILKEPKIRSIGTRKSENFSFFLKFPRFSY